jgi:hypothetical protein
MPNCTTKRTLMHEMHGCLGHRLQLQMGRSRGAPATRLHVEPFALLARRLSICYIHLVTLTNKISGFIYQAEQLMHCQIPHSLVPCLAIYSYNYLNYYFTLLCIIDYTVRRIKFNIKMCKLLKIDSEQGFNNTVDCWR